MKLEILAADFVCYNANNAGNHSPDCVKRAISLAFDISYQEAGKLLLERMHKLNSDSWKISPVYSYIIRQLGGSAINKIPEEEYTTLNDFIDRRANKGTFLVETGPKKSDKSINHIVCCIDGTVYDSWNSRNEIAKAYYVVEGVVRKEFTDIQDHMQELGMDLLQIVEDEGAKLIIKTAHKLNISPDDMYLKVRNISKSGFKLDVKCLLIFAERYYQSKQTRYAFEFSCVFTPSTTLEEAQKIIKNTAKTRLYDRFYAITQEEHKLVESYETLQEVGSAGEDFVDNWYLDGNETRFYKSLPGWCRGLVQWLDIQSPGQYSDSYTLRIKPLPWDTRSGRRVEFCHYNADPIRDMLKRYKEKHEIPYEDYDPYEEY